MLILKNTRYMRKHVINGSGIFDTISNVLKRLVTSNAARSVASNLSRAATTDLGKSAITAAKTVGKELATSAISTAKDLAISKGKQLIDRASAKALTPQSVEVIKKLTGLEPNTPVKPFGPGPSAITQKSKDILTSLINSGANEASVNVSKILMGHGIKTGPSAIRIQDLVRQTNTYGSGLRLA